MSEPESGRPVVFMFSGQGSQYYQMGRALYEHDTTFRHHLDELDLHAQQEHNFSCVETLYGDSRPATAPFTGVLQSHPSLFMLQYALARRVMDSGRAPDCVLGASLGECCALSVAGCLPARQTLSLVIEQARHIELLCEKASMLSILADASLYENEVFLYGQSELAAVNFPGHFTVSGRSEAIDDIEYELQRRGIDFQRVSVSHAFHSECIDPAKPEIMARLSGVKLAEPQARFISCATASELGEITGPHLWRAARDPIRFQDTIGALEARGQYHYVDFSPTGTLGTFVKYCLEKTSRSTITQTLTPYGNARRNVEQLMEQLPANIADTRPHLRHSTA